jgi:hypothetical protein
MGTLEMRGIRVSSTVFGLLLAGIATAGFAGPAQADFRWDWRLRAPHFDIYPDQDYYDDDGSFDDAYYEEYEEPIARQPKRAKKQELWWTEEAENFEPVYEPPVRKAKKKYTAKLQPKVIVKKKTVDTGKPLTDITAAREKFGKKPVIKTAAVAPVVKAEPKAKVPKLQQVASLDKQDKKQSVAIGCTAGAGVVTGYGFGSVRPKVCTGATYAYDAARGGKNYLIRLSAASGEILEVKKIN